MPSIPQAFRESFPLVFTSFVNKCGQIGLTLLPILIIEKNISIHEGSFILGAIKASAFAGTYLGGWSSDSLGLRQTILISFLGCAIGLGALPFVPSVLGIMVFGMIAQTGHAMFPSAARMMLTTMLPGNRLKEGVGWLRAANNCGQIVSYGLGAFFAGLGTLAFFYLDAATSFVAAGLGLFLLPVSARAVHTEAPHPNSVSVLQLLNPKNMRSRPIRLFIHCSVLMGLYSLIYEILLIGVASKTKLVFGINGLTLFSQYMTINVILCTLFAVPAARFFKNAGKTFFWGFVILGLGGVLSLKTAPTRLDLFVGSLLMTFGEIIFSSTAQFTLLNLVPASKTKGALYSISIIFQKIGMVIAGVITLPLVVNGDYAAGAIILLTLVSVQLVRMFPFGEPAQSGTTTE